MTNTADLDSYVFEGASQESKDAHLEDFKHDLNDELAKIFPATSRPYNNVQVLLLCWEEADSNNHDDLLYFQKYLEKDFKYKTQIYKIRGSGRNPDKQGFDAELRDCRQTSTPNTLSIIYYNGHGYSNASIRSSVDDRKDLVLFPSAKEIKAKDLETKNLGIPFTNIHDHLQSIPGAILHILECCCGGGAALSTSQEILAACSYNSNAKREKCSLQRDEKNHDGKQPSAHFLRALTSAMQALQQNQTSFTAEELFREVNSIAQNLDPPLKKQPWYIKGVGKPSVTLTKLLPRTTVSEKLLLEVSMPKGAANIEDFRRWARSSDRPEYINDINMLGYAVDKPVEMADR